jgi:predicted kinase
MMANKSLFDGLAVGSRPCPADLLDALEKPFPLISQMAATPQDPEWHAEGNVRVHTEMVIAEAYELTAGLDPASQLALILSAALHDIGKTLVTRKEQMDGKIRITSPRHAARGRSYVAPRLPALNFSEEINQRILAGIGYHHDPRKLISHNAPKSSYWRFSRNAEAKMIYLLELADTRGRINASSQADASETTELFRLACEEFDIWDVRNPYENWDKSIRSQLEGETESAIQYTLAEARRQFEIGEIHTPEEAISKTHGHRGNFPELVVTCAPSGSGKSCWIDRNLPDHLRISLDVIREELTGRRDRMTMEGQVIQLAKKRLRAALAAKKKVVWDATSLRLDGRSAIVGLGHDYHALTTVVAFATPPEILFRRNHERTHQIPNSVIERQLDSLEWPTACEAHRFITIQ